MIYCSETTSKLVEQLIGINPKYLAPLPLERPTIIANVEVTLIDANHCPGAVQFLFKLSDGRRFIHTGDMRFSPSFLQNPHLQAFKNCDAMYLDTTYCKPKHVFPLQEDSIEYVASTIKDLLLASPLEGKKSSSQEVKRLFLISTYGIGKERILKAVYDRCGVPLCVSERKAGVFDILVDEGFLSPDMFTTDPGSTPVHVTQWGVLGDTWPYFRPNFVAMEEYRRDYGVDEVIGFVPTGWLYEMKKNPFSVRKKGSCYIHLVPYSEHSSFSELKEYVAWVRPHKVMPTVNCEGADGEKNVSKMLDHFRHLVDETTSKAKFLQPLLLGAAKEESVVVHEEVPFTPPDVPDELPVDRGSCFESASTPSKATELGAILNISIDHAKKLLMSASGNIDQAVNVHLDSNIQPPLKKAKLSPSSNNKTGVTAGQQRSIMQFLQRRPETEPSRKAKKAEEGMGGMSVPAGELVTKPPPLITPVLELRAVPRDVTTLALDKYDPIEHSLFMAGSPVPYLHVSRSLEAMDNTTKRLKIGDVLTNMFRSIYALAPEDLTAAAYLVTGEVAPAHENVELNVGGSIVMQAVSEVSGVSRSKLRDLYVELGDPGDVAAVCKGRQPTLVEPKPLTVRGVFATLKGIARMTGPGSTHRKRGAILGMLRSCKENDIKYIVRTLVRALRVGANWRSVVPSLARAALIQQEEGGDRLPSKARLDGVAASATAAFQVCPDLQMLVDTLLQFPAEEVAERLQAHPGIPIKPMLARPAAGLADAVRLATRQNASHKLLAEFKYDGIRAQIHILKDGSARVFSRNCEDRASSFPDVIAALKAAMADDTTELIVDAELVAVDRSNGNRPRPFQELASRSRGETTAAAVTIDVCVYLFDLLHQENESLLTSPLDERRARLLKAVPFLKEGHIQLAQGQAVELDGQQEGDEETSLQPALKKLVTDAFAAGTEGLMLKALSSPYEPSKRSDFWLKLKKDYCCDDGLADTLDLVPIAAWHGQGRKAKWFSPILLACWDPRREEFQSVCRCISGFTDEFYKDMTVRLKQNIIPGPKPYYNTKEMPPMWLEPTEVWEIRGADLQLSPVHQAAVSQLSGSPRGLGLRFPRFIKVREDKNIEDATTANEIASIFNAQRRFGAEDNEEAAAADVPAMPTADELFYS